MKLLVFSDTHHRAQRLLNTVAQHEGDVDACIHLGDGIGDALQLQGVFPHIPVYMVQGNCDPARNQPSESLEPFGGISIFFTHGHAYGVKDNLDALWWHAKRRGAGAVLYGHTHIPNYTFQGGLHLFNPGSLSLPRFGPATYGLITIADGAPTFEICRYED